MTLLDRPHHATQFERAQFLEHLEHLERTAQGLWSIEPESSVADRAELMTRLSAVSTVLDRVRVRTEIRPDEATDIDVLDDCFAQLAELTGQWFAQTGDAL